MLLLDCSARSLLAGGDGVYNGIHRERRGAHGVHGFGELEADDTRFLLIDVQRRRRWSSGGSR